jgi:hypothetical protein
MLSGEDVNKILAEARVMSPIVHSWAQYTSDRSNDEEIGNIYRALARKYFPALIDHVQPISVNDCLARKLFMDYKAFMSAIHASKRGAVLLCSRFRSKPCAHIAAFEDGLIYDGNLEGPISAHDYYRLLATDSIMAPYVVVAEY